ncbi:MAG TPA: GPP34 family phosphoprotein [Firmicutes bacterium]|nr:GPP34 family phosphoprotein [Bacillota bacterium]
MKDLSITQEFLMCALNAKGKLPLDKNVISVCIIAGAIIELLQNGDIQLEGNHIVATKDSKKDLSYLHSLLNEINVQDSIQINKLLSQYVLTFTDKKIDLLILDISHELVKKQYATKVSNGMFVKKERFIPNETGVDRIVEKIRAELLEEGCISEETIALVTLLDKSNLIKKYFSSHESKKLKERLKEIRSTSQNQLVKQMIEYVDTMMATMTVILTSTVVN